MAENIIGNQEEALLNGKIGEPNDSEYDQTLFGKSYVLLHHAHSPQWTLPALGSAAALVAGNSLALGNAVQVIPINTITSPFDIHFLNALTVTANASYELILYSDSACTQEVARTQFSRSLTPEAINGKPIITGKHDGSGEPIPANSGIWAKLRSTSNGAGCTISLEGHNY